MPFSGKTAHPHPPLPTLPTNPIHPVASWWDAIELGLEAVPLVTRRRKSGSQPATPRSATTPRAVVDGARFAEGGGPAIGQGGAREVDMPYQGEGWAAVLGGERKDEGREGEIADVERIVPPAHSRRMSLGLEPIGGSRSAPIRPSGLSSAYEPYGNSRDGPGPAYRASPPQPPLRQPTFPFPQPPQSSSSLNPEPTPKPRNTLSAQIKALRQNSSESLETYYARANTLLNSLTDPTTPPFPPSTPLPPHQHYILDSICESFAKGLLDPSLSSALLDFLDEQDGPVSLAAVYARALEESRGLERRDREGRRAQKRRRLEALEELYGYISDVRDRNELVRRRFGTHVNRIVDFLDALSEDPGFAGRAPWE